jgi:hypothetical protein
MDGTDMDKPHFTIRDISWLTLVVAVFLAWWMDHGDLAARNRFVVETIRKSDREPIVLRDTQSDVLLIRDVDVWRVSVPVGKPFPAFDPNL